MKPDSNFCMSPTSRGLAVLRSICNEHTPPLKKTFDMKRPRPSLKTTTEQTDQPDKRRKCERDLFIGAIFRARWNMSAS